MSGVSARVLLSAAVVLGAGVHDLAPIQITAIQSHDQHLGGGDVGGHGDVVQVAHTEQLVLGLVVACGGAGVAEIQKHVDLVIGNAGGDLLLTALLLLGSFSSQFTPDLSGVNMMSKSSAAISRQESLVSRFIGLNP